MKEGRKEGKGREGKGREGKARREEEGTMEGTKGRLRKEGRNQGKMKGGRKRR